MGLAVGLRLAPAPPQPHHPLCKMGTGNEGYGGPLVSDTCCPWILDLSRTGDSGFCLIPVLAVWPESAACAL